MTDTTLPAPDPWVHDDALPYWEAARAHRLVLPRCRTCATVIWYPRGFCPSCSGFDIEWFEASGRGTVYAFSVSRKGQGAYRDAAPYILAYVELDEGPRVMTNVVDVAIDATGAALAVGDPVVAVFHDTERGNALLRFRPATPG